MAHKGPAASRINNLSKQKKDHASKKETMQTKKKTQIKKMNYANKKEDK